MTKRVTRATPGLAPEAAVSDHLKWLLLLLPVFLAVINSNWLYTPSGSIDPWVYFGYFQHPAMYKGVLFPNLYYGTRLPWILPGFLAYHWLTPALANIVLHFAFYYAAVFSMYALLKRGFGKWNALLGTVVFGTGAGFIAAIGWDYVDGAGLTYNLLALACAARAAESTRRRRLWLMLTGAAAFAMFYTNLFLLVFIPFPAALYLFLTMKGSIRGSMARVIELAIWFTAGVTAITVALGAINYLLDGHFWFYLPSVRAFFLLNSQQTSGLLKDPKWVRTAFWLGVPMAAAAGSLVWAAATAARRSGRFWGDYRWFFVLQYLAAAAGMVLWYFLGGLGLQLNYYSSYLLPSMYLAIGSILAMAGDEWKPRVYWSVLAFAVAGFALSFQLTGGTAAAPLQSFGFAAMIAVAAIGLAVRAVLRRWVAVPAALLGLIVFQLAYPPVGRLQPVGEQWSRIVEAANAAWPLTAAGPTYFWYDDKERYAGEYTSISAVYLGGFTSIGTRFPAVEVTYRLRAGSTVALLAEGDDAVERARRELGERHLRSEVVKTVKIARGGVAYNMTFLGLDNPAAQSITLEQHGKSYTMTPLTSAYPPEFPPSGWQLGMYPDGKPKMEQRPDGLLFTTANHQYAHGSLYGPLVAARAGTYHFTLRYQVLTGGLLYGGLAGDMSTAIGKSEPHASVSNVQVETYTVKLNAGESVILVVNNEPPAGGPSTYLIQSLKATAEF